MATGLLLLVLTVSADLPSGAGTTPWPFAPADRPHRVSNLFHEPLRLEEARGYLHGGIDIRVPARTPVLSVARGTVWVYREGGYDNLVLTEPNGDSWEYRHLAADFVPSAIQAAMEEGTQIEVGDPIGEVGPWGLGYTHLHLNRRRADGSITDPLGELIPLADSYEPVIRAIDIVPAGGVTPWTADPDGAIAIAGSVDIVCDIVDRTDLEETFLHPPRRARAFVVPVSIPAGEPQEVARWNPFEVSLPGVEGHPVPRYPRGPGLRAYQRFGPLALRNPIPRPGLQRLSIRLGRGDPKRPGVPHPWDTRTLPDGLYTLRVIATDRRGNEGAAKRRIRIANDTPLQLPDEPPPEPLARTLPSHAFVVAYRGDRCEHTFRMPPGWSTRPPLPPTDVLVEAREDERGTIVTLEIETSRRPLGHSRILVPFLARDPEADGSEAGGSETGTSELDRDSDRGWAPSILTIDLSLHPLVEVAPTDRRVRRSSDGTLLVHVRLRTPAESSIGAPRWHHSGEDGRATVRLDRIVDPHCHVLSFEIPSRALGGTLIFEVVTLGRTEEVRVELPRPHDDPAVDEG